MRFEARSGVDDGEGEVVVDPVEMDGGAGTTAADDVNEELADDELCSLESAGVERVSEIVAELVSDLSR